MFPFHYYYYYYYYYYYILLFEDITHIHKLQHIIFFEPNLKVLHCRRSADVDLQTELLTQNVRTRCYLPTKFNTSVSSAVLVTTIKFKTKESFRTANALLYCSLQKKSL